MLILRFVGAVFVLMLMNLAMPALSQEVPAASEIQAS